MVAGKTGPIWHPVTIQQTFLTQTKDLFFILQDQNEYTLYMIDLDESNEFESEGQIDPATQFEINPIFKYTEDQVNFQTLN